MTDQILSTQDVETEYGLTGDTLRYWRAVDEGPASFKLGRRVFYRRSEVERWIEAQEKATLRGGVA